MGVLRVVLGTPGGIWGPYFEEEVQKGKGSSMGMVLGSLVGFWGSQGGSRDPTLRRWNRVMGAAQGWFWGSQGSFRVVLGGQWAT